MPNPIKSASGMNIVEDIQVEKVMNSQTQKNKKKGKGGVNARRGTKGKKIILCG